MEKGMTCKWALSKIASESIKNGEIIITDPKQEFERVKMLNKRVAYDFRMYWRGSKAI